MAREGFLRQYHPCYFLSYHGTFNSFSLSVRLLSVSCLWNVSSVIRESLFTVCLEQFLADGRG